MRHVLLIENYLLNVFRARAVKILILRFRAR